MSNSRGISRRRFLRRTAAASVAGFGFPYVLSPSALGANGATAASERITVGFIGIGKMGKGVIGSALGFKELQVLAVCDVWKKRQDWGRSRVEDHYSGEVKKGAYHGCAACGDFREITERSDIDAVMIATPPHWHAVMAVRAAESGKDVFCEKPLARTIGEARVIARTVQRYGRVLQTNSWQRSCQNFRFACEMVRSGRIGKIERVHVNVGGPSVICNLPGEPVPEGLDWDMWLGPAPLRPYNKVICPLSTNEGWPQWRSFRDYDGGSMTDIGAHHFDIAQWGLGTDDTGPVEIHPPGVVHELLTYKYANGIIMHHQGGKRGIDFVGEKGRVIVDRGHLSTEPAEIMQEPTKPGEVHLYKSDNHIGDWVECMKERRKPICNEEVGCRSVTICHLGNFAYWLKRSLKWDPDRERFIGDDEANRMLMGAMRSPWRL